MNSVRVATLVLLLVFLGLATAHARSISYKDKSAADGRKRQAVRLAIRHQLRDIDAMQSFLDRQLDSLREQKRVLGIKKRGYTACMVHAIACYKKRAELVRY